MCALCVVVVPIKVVGQEQGACQGAPNASCRLQKPLRGVQQRRMVKGFKGNVELGYMDTTNMDARTSTSKPTTGCPGTARTSRYTATSGYNSRSSHAKQCYSARIVPDAPVSGPTPDEYDDAIGAEQQREQSSHVAEADGGDASQEQRLRRLGEWLMLLNAIKSDMCCHWGELTPIQLMRHSLIQLLQWMTILILVPGGSPVLPPKEHQQQMLQRHVHVCIRYGILTAYSTDPQHNAHSHT